MFAVVARHNHQLETAVLAVCPGGPVRVHDLDATRFLARSWHDPRVENSACGQRRQQTMERAALLTRRPSGDIPAHWPSSRCSPSPPFAN
jgi:hypothetical protein